MYLRLDKLRTKSNLHLDKSIFQASKDRVYRQLKKINTVYASLIKYSLKYQFV